MAVYSSSLYDSTCLRLLHAITIPIPTLLCFFIVFLKIHFSRANINEVAKLCLKFQIIDINVLLLAAV